MTPKNILVPVDFSPAAEAAARFAFDLARASDGEVTLLHVVEPPMVVTPDVMLLPPVENLTYDQYAEERAYESLEKLLKGIDRRGVEATLKTHVGPARSGIIDVAQEGGYDHIVVGTHGRTGLRRLLIGSVAEYVVRHAHCSVTAVRVPAARQSADQAGVA